AVRLAATPQPDVVVLDLEMPNVDGAQAIRSIREQQPAARVIVLTAFDSDERIIDAIKAGARGYLLKGLPRQELFQAIRIVHEGGSLLQPTIATRLITRVDQLFAGAGSQVPGAGGTEGLSPATMDPGPGPHVPAPVVSGVATFLFTDVRGFTAIVDRLGDQSASALL